MSASAADVLKEVRRVIDETRAAADSIVWVESPPPPTAEAGYRFFAGTSTQFSLSVVGHELRGAYDGALAQRRTMVRLPKEDAKFFFEKATAKK